MATNFPSSADNFTNPTSGDTLDSPDHAAQHADVNDAVEAIETALLDGAPLHIDDANQRVGIGTASPAYPLDVSGDINTSGQVTATNTRTLLDSGHTLLPTSSTIHEIVFSNLPTSDYSQFDIEIDWDNTSGFVSYGWWSDIFTPHNSSWVRLQHSETRDVTNNNQNFWTGGHPGFIFPAPDQTNPDGNQARSGGHTRMHLSVGGFIWGTHVMKNDPASGQHSPYYVFVAKPNGTSYNTSTNGLLTGFKLVGEDYFGWGNYYQVEFDYRLYGVNV